MNEKIVQIFEEIADMLEILGESVFRIRAYRRGAETVRNASGELSEDLPGIGKDLAAKIVEIQETGQCEMHERLAKKLSPGILDILRVRGIGPKKVKLFYESLGINTLEKLRAAAESGALATLPRMGEKSAEGILKALEQGTYEQKRIPYGEAKPLADDYLDYMKQCGELKKVAYAGSLRRERETIGDIDILATGSDAAKMSQHFVDYPKVKQVLAHGPTKSSVVIEEGETLVQVDFRVVDKESFGAALYYFTGPKHYNIKVRTVALKKGLKVNEYGLFDGEKQIAGETEQSMFETLGLPVLSPKEREGAV